MITDKLLPPDSAFGPTGATRHDAKITDQSMANIPAIADEITAGVANSGGWVTEDTLKVEYIQQGQSCVANSTGIDQSIKDWRDGERWLKYDADELYFAAGGPPDRSQGVRTETVLRIMRDRGARQTDSSRMARIAGWAYAPQIPGAFRQTVAAGIETHGSVLIAALLPQGFGSRDVKPDTPLTTGYHQMSAARWTGLRDEDGLLLPSTWGRKEFDFLCWGLLERNDFQNHNGFRHCYAATSYDLDDLSPEPAPNPPLGLIEFTAKVKVKRTGKVIFSLTTANPALVGLQGHDVEIVRPVQCFGKIGQVEPLRAVLRKAGGCGFVSGQYNVALKLRA